MNEEALTLDAARCVLIIQDMQNDVVMEGGAFAARRLDLRRQRGEFRASHVAGAP